MVQFVEKKRDRICKTPQSDRIEHILGSSGQL